MQNNIIMYEHSRCMILNSELVNKLSYIKAMVANEIMDIPPLRSHDPRNVISELIQIIDNSVLLESSSYVGFIASEDVCINILPKFYKLNKLDEKSIEKSLTLLTYMFIRSLGINKGYSILASYFRNIYSKKTYSLFFELLSYMFLVELLRQFNMGIYRRYKRIVGEEKFLRGKLLHRQFFKPLSKWTTFSIEYYKLSVDNLLNRVFFYASSIVNRYTRFPENRRLSKGVMEILQEANVVRNPLEGGIEPVFNRLNDRYKYSYLLAKTIIESYELTGSTYGLSFFINMNTLFESYIYSILREHYDKVIYQYSELEPLLRDVNTKAPFLEQQPDIFIRSKEKGLIIDVKYKLYNIPKLTRSKEGRKRVNIADDVRQVYTYLKLAQYKMPWLKHTALVCLHSSESNDEPVTIIGEYKYSIERDSYLHIIGINPRKLIEDPKSVEVALVEKINSIFKQ